MSPVVASSAAARGTRRPRGPLLGMNVSPLGTDHASLLWGAGVRAVCFPLWPEVDVREIVLHYQSRGIFVVPRADAKTFSVRDDPHRVAQFWKDQIGDLCSVIQWGSNEFDGPHGGTSSTASEAQVYEQLFTARRVFATQFLIGPNLVTGQPSAWTRNLDSQVDAIGLSRYPNHVSEMADGIYGPEGYKRHSLQNPAYGGRGKPVWFLEFPLWGEAYLREALRISDGPPFVYTWHAWWQTQNLNWTDAMVDLAGNPTWRLPLYTKVAKEAEVMAEEIDILKARIELLEKQGSLRDDLIARILSGEWDEGPGSAEALLRAIAPKYSSFEAARFPKA